MYGFIQTLIGGVSKNHTGPHFLFMAKDPAFLFYYDRFLSGTFTMSNEQVGMYIRLLCLQANKGHITKKDMLNICGTYDEDIACKFSSIGNDMYVNEVLSEVVNQRKAYTESRRNNRKGAKKQSHEEHMNNICESYDDHMVNVIVNKDVDENVFKGGVGEKQDMGQLTADELDIAFEFMTRLGRKEITHSEILNYWEAFKLHKPDAAFQSRGKQMQHFRDWMKFQKNQTVKNGTTHQPGNGKPNLGKSAGFAMLTELAKGLDTGGI